MSGSEKKKLNIYLDHCCYNRPYDDQSQLRVEFETKAKLFIQNLIVDGKVDLTVSYMSEQENSDNPFSDRRIPISEFFSNAKTVVTETEEVIENAERYVRKGLKAHDSLHLSCAVAAGCDYFLTTDDRIHRRADDRIVIINPVEFIKTWERNRNDE